MKICQLCSIDFVLHHFIQPLAEATAAAGHDVTCVCADGPLVAKVRAAGLRVETAPLARSFDLRAHWRAYRHLRDFFRREKFDLVHVHNPVAAQIGRAAAWRAGVPRIVYTAHGFYFHEAMPWPKRRLFIALEWLAGRVTDVLFTQAEEDADAARRYRLCRGGVVQAIGNGVDPGRFHPAPTGDDTRARLRAALGTPEDAPVIVMTGRLVAEKGYPELFEAMRAVDAHLWIAGARLPSDHAGSIAGEVDKVEADPALASRIRFLGYRADMPDILRAADLFTLPSHREGMPRSIIEAMMTGLAVVATDIRGAREEVVDGETGALVPVRDPAALAAALDRLAKDPALRDRLGAAGRRRALDLYDEAKVIARQLDRLGLAGPKGGDDGSAKPPTGSGDGHGRAG